jgi:glycosyltransferase involved in cell wall biosynthesis
MMRKLLINGYFLCQCIGGVERYAVEITRRLDGLSSSGEISIIVPGDIPEENIPEYKNITVIRHDKIRPRIYWQMIILQWFLIKNRKYIVLEFENATLPLAPGIVFLHDIYYKFFPDDFTSKHDKHIRLYNKLQYRLISKTAKQIVTVSEFSKDQIVKTYRVKPDRIAVIYNGWDHYKDIISDLSIFDEFPILAKVPFYFSLGNLSKRKNIKCIIEYAAKHPDYLFAVSGLSSESVKGTELDKPGNFFNVILLDYLSDGKVKALMEKCRAFIMPSYYEGFGLPPLEALSCGADIIVAKSASLPEIYGKTARYIDPFDVNIDLEELLCQKVDTPDELLKKYSFNTAAEQVYTLIQKFTNKKEK